MLHLKTGLGQTLEAKVGGDYAPDVGDPGKTMTKVTQLGPRTLQLTDMRAAWPPRDDSRLVRPISR